MAAQPPRSPKQPKKDASAAPSSVSKSAPATTKAERRAKQEKEREAKALAKASGNSKANGTKSGPSKANSSAPTASIQQHKASKATEAGKPTQVPKEALPANPAVEPLAQETRGLRIFSHFGLPKHTGPSSMKGPLHPTIFRLGLQFSEFRIVGANARCIATLNAFKTVCPLRFVTDVVPHAFYRLYKTMPHRLTLQFHDIL